MAKPPKIRVDTLLVERGLAESREKARALVMAGSVFAGDRRIDKSGQTLAGDSPLRVKGAPHPWVSRGGIKLAHALEHFKLSASGAVAVDVGASTGGFTDVLLEGGARKVYAVDVGHGQFAWKLRQDDRVVVLERTNARHLDREHVPEPVDLIVCDVSFIGLELVLPPVMSLVASPATLIALIKPQFEVGREQVGKKGVVRDPRLHDEVRDRIRAFIGRQLGWHVLGVSESPIQGPEGNREFLIAARFDDDCVMG
jgi:23S rRNA (cytidine1920-2'-O)/16S rRNA (cytidine1409-2'-O)-methyltransferase